MPIEFPLPLRGNLFDRWLWQSGAKPLSVQRAANLASVGKPFTARSLSPGLPQPVTTCPNLRNLGKMYRSDGSCAVVNPVNTPFTARRIYDRVLTTARWELTGVSRDSTGAVLGLCRVLVFRTDTNVFLRETTSDANGAWTLYLVSGWPLFLVEYLAGSPDRAGTSLNTLSPTQV